MLRSLYKAIIKKFGRYFNFVLVGVSGTALVFLMTFVLTEYLHLWYLLAYIISTLCGWTYGFIMNSKFTFNDHDGENLIKRYVFYIQGYILLSLISFSSVYVLTSILNLHYLVSMSIITVIMSIITFNFNRKFIFQSSQKIS
ncbi:GtrA family protein [Candidatus Parcubacteria bacterium]|jgi:putative flippase GtrA|nr:GtrA family protein [Candidatus Parcubacteria bacterium]